MYQLYACNILNPKQARATVRLVQTGQGYCTSGADRPGLLYVWCRQARATVRLVQTGQGYCTSGVDRPGLCR